MPRPSTTTTAMNASPRLSSDILVNGGDWDAQADSEAVVERAIAAAAAAAKAPEGAEVAILLTDDATIRTLNRDWRGFDKPTNVLSFPAAPQPGAGAGAPPMLGDIAIAYETTAREAETEGKTFADHLAHLAVHGLLHLLGYDHETDTEAEIMEGLERDVLASLGIADPYAEKDERN